jgi:hypothetical protein
MRSVDSDASRCGPAERGLAMRGAGLVRGQDLASTRPPLKEALTEA